jgi:alanyl-tRNA synthetase
MTANEVRRSFLAFFEHRGHRIVASSPLVPHDDPTLLFTNAGMNQFKDVFLGRETRDYSRATTAQKCMRVSGKHNDLENVGPSLRHHTFFEMLGNFSFGDYFKKDAIALAWQLLTDVWRLPPDRLVATVFAGEAGVPRDDEAWAEWRRLPVKSIAELGMADNFWSMGETGPCGRCSEIHYFRGDEFPCDANPCLGVACSCDRYVEIWNNVFMEFNRHPDGTLAPLPAPSIDTGMGLERIVAVLQGRLSNYDTDLFHPLIERIEELSGEQYAPCLTPQASRREKPLVRAAGAHDVHFRVIADHSRAMTFLIGDGVLPSNEWRGYVLRKIMRRAMRHGKHLGMTEPFLHRLVEVLVREMGAAYPEIARQRAFIEQTILAEERRFDAVLNQGLPRLEAEVAAASAEGVPLSGAAAFRLYDTFGVPLDFIEDVAEQKGVVVDRSAFDGEMGRQREKARAKSAFEGRADEEFALDDEQRDALERIGDQFEGYAATKVPDAVVLALFDGHRNAVSELGQGDSGFMLLDRTPFYLEAGGQVSDQGTIVSAADASARVDGVARTGTNLPRAHRVAVTAGRFKPRDRVTPEVDISKRDSTRRNHTATHLLHAALRQVLGTHVKQAGSLVAPDRLRFDFAHTGALTREEIETIERIVNDEIARNTTVVTEVRPTAEAIAGGAMALFGEKYGDRVRVVSVPGFSVELCGGTHVRATGDIGFFSIVEETGVAAGVRRIEAVTGSLAIRRYQNERHALGSVLRALHTTPEQAPDAVERLQGEVKRLGREVSQLKMTAALGGAGATRHQADDAADIGGVRVVARRADGLDRTALRTLADTLRDRQDAGVVVLAGETDGRVFIVVSVAPDLTRQLQAGQLVKALAPIVGGGGGGRPDFAEAGGKDPSKIDAALAESYQLISKLLAS